MVCDCFNYQPKLEESIKQNVEEEEEMDADEEACLVDLHVLWRDEEETNEEETMEEEEGVKKQELEEALGVSCPKEARQTMVSLR